ncbi:unnamed protein product [Symbiodinium microadriaticum]|nr:unnamed protein product [Symbiodinium microadriaticum]
MGTPTNVQELAKIRAMRANAIAAVDASAAPAQGFGRHSVRKLKPRLGWSQIGAKFWQTPSDSCPVVEAPTILDRVVQAAWDPTLEAEMRSVCVKQSTKSQDDSTGPFAVIRGGSRYPFLVHDSERM